MGEQEILEELKNDQVVEIKRIISKKSGIENKTHLYILTFNLPTLPETINIGFYKIRIKIYVPNPIRCRKCLKFGHFSDTCQKEEICAFCTKPIHTGTPCLTIVPSCANCEEKHHSFDTKCSKFIDEKGIKLIQFRDKVTYGIARKQYFQMKGTSTSYSEVTRKKKVCVDIGTQTDIFIAPISKEKVMMPSIPSTSSTCNQFEITSNTKIPPPLVQGSLSLAPAAPLSLPPAPTPPLSPRLPTPPLPPPHVPVLPLPKTPSRPPREDSSDGTLLPTGSKYNEPPILNQVENPPIFQTPLPPRRGSINKTKKRNSKNKKQNTTKSEDEMETT